MNRRTARLAALLLGSALLCGTACRTPPVQPSTAPAVKPRVQRVEMDPVRFRVDPSGRVVAEFLDPKSLFEDADRLYREKKYALAVKRYRLLLQRHPRTRYLVVSLYNLGLALEKVGRCDEAVTAYRRLIAQVPRERDAIDASFRLSSCLAKLERWREVIDTLTPLLLRNDLKQADRFEARVRKGRAHLEVGELNDAERTLLRAVRLYQEAARREPLGERSLLAQAFFLLGEVARKRMVEVDLSGSLPQPELARRLNRKGRLLLVSQARFLRAVRTADHHWAPAAGHQLGALYERFHQDIMGAPIPPQLNQREREVYQDELRRKVRPLIRKAVGIYERNLRLSERLRANGPWVLKTRERMERLKRLLGTSPVSAASGAPQPGPQPGPLGGGRPQPGPVGGGPSPAGKGPAPSATTSRVTGASPTRGSVGGGASGAPTAPPQQTQPGLPGPGKLQRPAGGPAPEEAVPTNAAGGS